MCERHQSNHMQQRKILAKRNARFHFVGKIRIYVEWLIEAAHNADISAVRKCAADVIVKLWLQSSGKKKYSPASSDTAIRSYVATATTADAWIQSFKKENGLYWNAIDTLLHDGMPSSRSPTFFPLGSFIRSFLFLLSSRCAKTHIHMQMHWKRLRQHRCRCRRIINKIDGIRIPAWNES